MVSYLRLSVLYYPHPLGELGVDLCLFSPRKWAMACVHSLQSVGANPEFQAAEIALEGTEVKALGVGSWNRGSWLSSSQNLFPRIHPVLSDSPDRPVVDNVKRLDLLQPTLLLLRHGSNLRSLLSARYLKCCSR